MTVNINQLSCFHTASKVLTAKIRPRASGFKKQKEILFIAPTTGKTNSTDSDICIVATQKHSVTFVFFYFSLCVETQCKRTKVVKFALHLLNFGLSCACQPSQSRALSEDFNKASES